MSEPGGLIILTTGRPCCNGTPAARRMKTYSPLNLWLLVAATLAVDAVAIVWLIQDGNLGFALASVLYDALLSGQLGVVCLWAVFRARTNLRGFLGVTAAVLVASAPSVRLRWIDNLGDACGIYGSNVVVLLLALWGLKRTRLWRQLTGNAPTVWQFSMAHLLVAMTLVGVLITLLRRSEFAAPDRELWRFLTLLTLGDVLVVLATTIAWATPWHWLPRLAMAIACTGTLGALSAVGVAVGLTGSQTAQFFSLDQFGVDFAAYAIIAALVVFAWLEIVPLVPHARRAASLPPAGADASSQDHSA